MSTLSELIRDEEKRHIFTAGFRAALEKVRPGMHAIEVMQVEIDTWAEFCRWTDEANTAAQEKAAE